MGRPSEHDKRIEIARRAVDILQREGLEISVARLADALDLKRPTLLYHFPTYSHIVETALEDLLVEQAAFVLSEINDVEHPIDRLFAQIKAVHKFHHNQEQRIVFLSQAIAACAGSRFDEILAIGQKVFEPHRLAIVESLRNGIRDGIIAPCDPEALYSVVRAVMDGLLVQRVMTGINLQPVHSLLWDHLFAPLKLPPTKPLPTKANVPTGRKKN